MVGAEAHAVHGGAEEDADVADFGEGAWGGAAFGMYGVAAKYGAHGQGEGEGEAGGSCRIRPDCSG